MPCPYSLVSQMRVGARQYRYFGLRLMIADAVPLQFGISRCASGHGNIDISV
ncbi:hypothetical protein [Microseira wollei]|uniref:hypothetical protein n=1 Tax=Microseira wollei TaxID=467598 RepID=UPI001CFE51E2|nr:hypothetical protein [Microseira wollei]